VNPKRLAPLILAVLTFNTSLWARRPHRMKDVTSVRMEYPKDKMVAVSCQINGARRWYVCVIDSGATGTIISDRVVKAEGPSVALRTGNGIIQVHQREVSLTIAGLELKPTAAVSHLMPQDIDILVGQDVLRQFRSVIFDYEKQQVEFHR
jgi:gag-polyprotein putative aspartyl protease